MSRHVIHVTVDLGADDADYDTAAALAEIRDVIEKQLDEHCGQYPIWNGYSGPPVTQVWTA